MNSPLNIVNIQHDNKNFHLIQETVLTGGTKERGLAFFQKLANEGYKEVVIYGTTHGYSQVASTLCSKKVGLKCTVFLPRTFPRTPITKQAIEHGANIVDVWTQTGYPSISVLTVKANDYASKDVSRKLIHLGLDDPEYINALADNIGTVKGNIDPERMWLTAGSGTLLRTLHKVFPNCHFCVVQVGRKIYPDILEGITYTLYVAPEPFKKDAEILPPYTSLSHYDAKLWRFASQYGKDGDYIWNVK